MRPISLSLTLLLIAAVAAAPVVPDEAESPYPLMSLGIPDQTVDGWYERGDPEREAEELEHYLQALIWGPGGEAEATAQGRRIEVELIAGVVIMRETPENLERVRKEVDPSLQTLLRRMELAEGPAGRQVSSDTMSSAPGALPGIRVVGDDAPGQQQAAAGVAGRSLGSTASFTLRLDDSRTWRGLRVTLLDVFTDTDDDRLTTVLLLETTDSQDEIEIKERRSINFEDFRVRVVTAQEQPQEAEIELTYLTASAR
jgi:hypothetical protein